ncbi:cuticle protein 7-like [Macrobrachium rosenbergii]|uniref:cuticle protein 7-like n=1 Tax=Macrobrachium rosenbergii TaxID=79674 RepID=UPI0034D44A8F
MFAKTTTVSYFSLPLLLIAGALMATAYPDGYGKSAPIPYSFDYSVKGDYKGPTFDQNEKSDGKAVKGSYTVALPDGRKQTVEYTADDYSGFVAKVSYEGEAKHPSNYGPSVTFHQDDDYY